MEETATSINNQTIYFTGEGGFKTNNGTELKIKSSEGISPKLYFKYVKSKFGLIGGMKLERRIKKLWKLAETSEKFGQIALSEKYIRALLRETRESEMYAIGYKIFIEKEHLEKFRDKVKGRAIEITSLKNYIKIIPKDVVSLIEKAKAKKLFDYFVVVHYDPNSMAVARTEEEERKDPIVFGKIKESDRLYFIADWEDEYCDLTLDDIIDKLDLSEEEIKLDKNIK